MKCDHGFRDHSQDGEFWRGGDWEETQNGAHVMRRKGCAMQNQGITLIVNCDHTQFSHISDCNYNNVYVLTNKVLQIMLLKV